MDKDQESLVQQDFEEWASKHHGVLSIGKVDGFYSNRDVNSDWFVWKAAHSKYHKDVVVELPERHKYEDAGCYYDEMVSWEVIEALDKAGVKYK